MEQRCGRAAPALSKRRSSVVLCELLKLNANPQRELEGSQEPHGRSILPVAASSLSPLVGFCSQGGERTETVRGILERLQGCLCSALPHRELGKVFQHGAGGVLRGAGGGR